MISIYAVSLALLLPSSPSLEELIHQPLTEILKLTDAYSPKNLEKERNRLEREHDEANRASRKLDEEWKRQLAAARRTLQELNKTASADTEASSLRRSRLHINIAALERSLRENLVERQRSDRSHELRLAKLWLAERWPRRRAAIQQRVRQGEARQRPHGDIEDTGYRILAKDPQKDIEVGRQAVQQIVAGGRIPPELRDEEVQFYVRKVAERIAMNSDLKTSLHVTVLDSKELQAIALPGGYLYVTSGVIAAAETESALAGILSREIARIAARHAARTAKVSWLSRMFLPVTQIVGGIFAGGPANPVAYYGIGYGLEGLGGIVVKALNGDSEDLQFEADQLGIQYAWKAGYHPAGFISFLDSISPCENLFLPEKPPFRERVLHLFEEIEHLPAGIAAEDVGDFDRVRRRAAR